MFENLVESTRNRAGGKRKAAFLFGTATAWALGFTAALIVGVMIHDARLAEASSVAMLEFQPPPPPAPPPPLGTSKSPTGKSPTAASVTPREVPTTPPDAPVPESSDSKLPETLASAEGGSTFGVPGGMKGGVLGGIPGGGPGGVPNATGDGPPPPPPAPPKPEDPPPAPPKILARSEGVIRGNAVVRHTPEYPGLAKATRTQGDVVVELMISEDGNVISAHVVSGHPLLQAAALDAARRWKFKPTLLSNTPVKVTGILTFRFSM